eukprot:2321001-Rhodomonas_salina.1
MAPHHPSSPASHTCTPAHLYTCTFHSSTPPPLLLTPGYLQLAAAGSARYLLVGVEEHVTDDAGQLLGDVGVGGREHAALARLVYIH